MADWCQEVVPEKTIVVPSPLDGSAAHTLRGSLVQWEETFVFARRPIVASIKQKFTSDNALDITCTYSKKYPRESKADTVLKKVKVSVLGLNPKISIQCVEKILKMKSNWSVQNI